MLLFFYINVKSCHIQSGPGGSVSAFKFHPQDDEKFFTSQLNGEVCMWNSLTGKREKVFLETGTWE